ncbi:MAG: hypothetical protein CMN90_12730 [Sutterellaceae bacterium]|nr:hypothetical protein [Sutterellaceae bacterium]|tara:strand:+ start:1426 stop:2079 length:654 start_codon:yes stop_codon:yes gene_type:complete
MLKRLIPYETELINRIHLQLPHYMISENSLIGAASDGHQAEAIIQQFIVKLLVPHLPSPDLIISNRKARLDSQTDCFIPDLTINRIGGGVWGFIELKTLLTDDCLTEQAVAHDLKKLCVYKKTHPDAASVFILAGTRSRLSDSFAKLVWEKSGLCASDSAFSSHKLRPQIIADNQFVAIPCGSSGNLNEVITLSWEIQPPNTTRIQSAKYRFKAIMT